MKKLFRKEFIVFLILFLAAVFLYFLSASQASVIILAVLAFTAVFAALVTYAGGRKISLTFESATRELKKDREGEIRCKAENKSLFPVFCLEVILSVENLLTGESLQRTLHTGLLPKQDKSLSAAVKAGCCGMLECRIEEIRVCDPIGIFSRTIPSREEQIQLPVIPEVERAEIAPENLWAYDMESFRYAQNLVGSDTSETVGIREYVPGDNVRSIHWKLSAKTDTVVLREPGMPVDNRLMLLADKRLPKEGLSVGKIDEMTGWFLSLSYSLLEKNHHHTLGWYDYRMDEFITEKMNRTDDMYRILPGFLSAPWKEDELDTATRFAAAESEKNFASYLIISPSEENCAAGMDRIREYGQVTVLTPDGRV